MGILTRHIIVSQQRIGQSAGVSQEEVVVPPESRLPRPEDRGQRQADSDAPKLVKPNGESL